MGWSGCGIAHGLHGVIDEATNPGGQVPSPFATPGQKQGTPGVAKAQKENQWSPGSQQKAQKENQSQKKFSPRGVNPPPAAVVQPFARDCSR